MVVPYSPKHAVYLADSALPTASSNMVVSHNELINICSKAVASMKVPCKDIDKFSSTVAELEMVGLGGIKHFMHALSSSAKKTAPTTLDISTTSKKDVQVNLHSSSIMYYLPILLYYIESKLTRQNTIVLNVLNACNPWLAFGELVNLGAKGLSVKANWYDDKNDNYVELILNKRDTYPNLFFLKKGMHKPNVFLLEASTKNATFPPPPSYKKIISSTFLEKNKKKSWDSGISIRKKDWVFIKKFADKILVPSNETSHSSIKGA